MLRKPFLILCTFLSLVLAGCSRPQAEETKIACDPNNGGLTLPDGFCAVVVADSVGRARHVAVNENGDVYVLLRQAQGEGTVVGLRDTTGDGRADVIQRFGNLAGTGIGIYDGYLYVAPDSMVVRYRLQVGQLAPEPNYEIIATGFEPQGMHAAKSIALDGKGGLYVNVGSTSNNCQNDSIAVEPPGYDPCPSIERHAGIWRFDAGKPNQMQQGAVHFAKGVRNSVALAWNGAANNLYVVEHGRDILHSQWPKLYDEQLNAELPSERFFVLEEGKEYGWPYCYYDHIQGGNRLSPEYGGDGKEVGRCSAYPEPIMGFPGHYSPNALAFNTGDQFPETYRNGAFVAFHGSWNRAPYVQKGYNVVFVPFKEGRPSGDWQVFADRFAGVDSVKAPGDAAHRPTGVAFGPDGSLYVTDSVKGKVWRIVYTAAKQDA